MKVRPFTPRGARTLRASGDRWLFGYADVVTLLFACFAALYAAQAAVPSTSTVQAAAMIGPDPTAAHVEPAAPVKALTAEFGALAADEPQVHLDLIEAETGTTISLAETGSFALGHAELSPAAQRVIRKLADILKAQPFAVRVEGHTDNQPIRTAKYGSNWELSTARASRVVEFLITEGGLPPERLSAAGYGEFRPRVPNDTWQSRSRNRRVDIVVLDAGAVQGEASQADYRSVGTRPSDGR